MKNKAVIPKMLIGWREWLALPGLGVPAIKVKVDTGAKTSALHAFDVNEFERDGRRWVHFNVHPLQGREDVSIPCEAELVDVRTVTNSGGQRQVRHVVRTEIGLAGITWKIELTLTNRDEMKFRMLLGREAMNGRLVVDPQKSFRAGKIDFRKIYGL